MNTVDFDYMVCTFPMHYFFSFCITVINRVFLHKYLANGLNYLECRLVGGGGGADFFSLFGNVLHNTVCLLCTFLLHSLLADINFVY